MSIEADSTCILCGREPAEKSQVLYVVKAYVAKIYQYHRADINRYGGSGITPRGIICIECMQQYLPDALKI